MLQNDMPAAGHQALYIHKSFINLKPGCIVLLERKFSLFNMFFAFSATLCNLHSDRACII